MIRLMAGAGFRLAGPFAGWRSAPVTARALVVMIAATSCASAIAEHNRMGLGPELIYVPRLLAAGHLWRLITSLFVETSPLSLLFTTMLVFGFSRDLLARWSGATITAVFLSLGAAGNLAAFVAGQFYPPILELPYNGSWSVIAGLSIIWADRYPDRQLMFYF